METKNQSFNNRSIRPSINQSSKKPINRPTNQSINPSINRRSNNRETAIRCNSASARTPERKWRNFKFELSRKMRIEKLSWALVQALDKRLQYARDVYVFIYNWDEGACGELFLFLKLKILIVLNKNCKRASAHVAFAYEIIPIHAKNCALAERSYKRSNANSAGPEHYFRTTFIG